MIIKSYDKMFAILNLFTMDRNKLTIAEIEEELGLPKSTIFRVLNTLTEADFLEKDEHSHDYAPGFQFFRLGSIFQSNLDVRSVALPVMEDLVAASEETIELNIIDDIYRICIEKIDSPLPVRNFVSVGDRHPIHLGASGKILLSFTPDKEQEKKIDQLAEKYEAKTADLKEAVIETKKQGYAVTRGERVLGSFAIAAPILDSAGNLVASLTIAGPIQRLSQEREGELVQLIQNGAAKVSKHLGYFN